MFAIDLAKGSFQGCAVECYAAYGLSLILEARHRTIRRNTRMQDAAGETAEPVSSPRDHRV